MKIILRIMIILLAASAVAGALFFTTSNTSTISISAEAGFQPPVISGVGGQPIQPMEQPNGGEDGASLAGGLFGILATLGKLTTIATLVILAQKGFSLAGKRQLANTQE